MVVRRRLTRLVSLAVVALLCATPGGLSAAAVPAIASPPTVGPRTGALDELSAAGHEQLVGRRDGAPREAALPQRLRDLVRAAGGGPSTRLGAMTTGRIAHEGAPAADAAARGTQRCLGRRATIVGTNRKDRIVGTPRRDVIVAQGGNDVIRGRGGDDVICASGGDDRIDPGPGDDAVSAHTGDDVVTAGPGRDHVDGGGGSDWIDYGRARRATVSLAAGRGSGGERLRHIENVAGSRGRDKITGDAAANELWGGRGDDLVDGGAGDDLLCDGRRKDALCPGGGADRLLGGEGMDMLAGGEGDDVVDGGSGDFDMLLMLTAPSPWLSTSPRAPRPATVRTASRTSRAWPDHRATTYCAAGRA